MFKWFCLFLCFSRENGLFVHFLYLGVFQEKTHVLCNFVYFCVFLCSLREKTDFVWGIFVFFHKITKNTLGVILALCSALLGGCSALLGGCSVLLGVARCLLGLFLLM